VEKNENDNPLSGSDASLSLSNSLATPAPAFMLTDHYAAAQNGDHNKTNKMNIFFMKSQWHIWQSNKKNKFFLKFIISVVSPLQIK